MPCHVSQRTIDDEKEKHHEEHIGRKPHTLCKRTRNQRRGDDGKLHLEQGKQRQRNRGTAQHVACRSGIDGSAYVMKHGECERIADHAADVVAKAQREADHHPQHRNQSHGDKRLQHRRDDVLRTHHAAIEKRQTRCHHQHKNSGGNQPRHISRGDDRPVTFKRRLPYE